METRTNVISFLPFRHKQKRYDIVLTAKISSWFCWSWVWGCTVSYTITCRYFLTKFDIQRTLDELHFLIFSFQNFTYGAHGVMSVICDVQEYRKTVADFKVTLIFQELSIYLPIWCKTVKYLRYFFRFPPWTLCSTLCTRCATSFSWPLRTWEVPPRPPTATWPPWTGQYSTTGSNWGQTTSQRDSARTCDCNAAASASDVIFCAVKPSAPLWQFYNYH